MGKTSKKPIKKYPLETVDKATKRICIYLRKERELAATRHRRYLETLRSQPNCDIIIENVDDNDGETVIVIPDDDDDSNQNQSTEDLEDKLFYRARMKICNTSSECQAGICQQHDMILLLKEFEKYTGRSIDAEPTRPPRPEGGHSGFEGEH